MANDKKEPNLNDIRLRNNKMIEEFFLKTTEIVERRFDELNGYLNQLASTTAQRPRTVRVSTLNKYKRYKELIKSDAHKQRPSKDRAPKRSMPDSTNSDENSTENSKKVKNGLHSTGSSMNEQIANLTVELKIKHELVSSSSKDSNVILMWNLINKSDQSTLRGEHPVLDEIKEYQIFGFREMVNESPHKMNNCITNYSKWTLIGVVEPYCPPIKCTLTDFRQGSVYYFSIRIKFKNNHLSDFSQPSMIKL